MDPSKIPTGKFKAGQVFSIWNEEQEPVKIGPSVVYTNGRTWYPMVVPRSWKHLDTSRTLECCMVYLTSISLLIEGLEQRNKFFLNQMNVMGSPLVDIYDRLRLDTESMLLKAEMWRHTFGCRFFTPKEKEAILRTEELRSRWLPSHFQCYVNWIN